MVANRYREADATACEHEYADQGPDIGLRVYTSRLLGADRGLVLHGGGNTSVKTTYVDRLGEEVGVLAVKGSGADLATLTPAGLPALELAPLRRLLELDALDDDAMMAELRRSRVDPDAPNPSVETLLHAALPHKFVDHTHADAVLVLSNQPDGRELVTAALGEGAIVLPYVHPGFALARAVAAAHRDHPEARAIVILHHGIFTFGDEARTSYEAMVEFVDRAEAFATARIDAAALMTTGAGDVDPDFAALALPHVRGAVAVPAGETGFVRMACSWRRDPDLVAMSTHAGCAELVATGPLTPDHVLRTSTGYLYLTRDQAASREACGAAVAAFRADYQAYVARHAAATTAPLDGHPRVVVVEGLGVLAFGETVAAAAIAGDIAEQTLRGKARAAALGAFTPLPEADLLAMEYWPLERAKLGTRQPAVLEGQVALVAGGAGGIGFGVCESLVTAGAVLVVADLDVAAAERVVGELREHHAAAPMAGIGMDVTDPDSVAAAYRTVIERFGGVDIVVANAGIAHVSSLRDMAPEAFRKVVDVNLFGTMTVLREAARVFEAQDTRGSVVIQASKNVFAPGASFGAYSASKAGQHQLGKIAALELAPLGVRVNMINADAVFGDKMPSGLWQEVGPDRMKSRGLDEQGLRDYYRDRSLLKVSVTPRHVGEAVVFLCSERAAATTGMTFTVDGGVAAAFPR